MPTTPSSQLRAWCFCEVSGSRTKVATVATLIACLSVAIVALYIRSDRLFRRLCISAISSNIELGASPKEVTAQVFAASNGLDLRQNESHIEPNKRIILISGYTEFGATNWIVVVALCHERVIGVGIRTADSLQFRPTEAPKDRIQIDCMTAWSRMLEQCSAN